MDGYGIGIFIVSLLIYYFSKWKFFLFSAGVGLGLVIGAFWAMAIVKNSLR